MSRRLKYEEEDRKLLEKLQAELDVRQRERDHAEKQRRLELRNIEKTLVEKGYVPAATYPITDLQEEKIDDFPVLGVSKKPTKEMVRPTPVVQQPVPELEPKRYEQPPELPRILTEGQDVVSKLDRMLEDEENARKRGWHSILFTNS